MRCSQGMFRILFVELGKDPTSFRNGLEKALKFLNVRRIYCWDIHSSYISLQPPQLIRRTNPIHPHHPQQLQQEQNQQYTTHEEGGLTQLPPSPSSSGRYNDDDDDDDNNNDIRPPPPPPPTTRGTTISPTISKPKPRPSQNPIIPPPPRPTPRPKPRTLIGGEGEGGMNVLFFQVLKGQSRWKAELIQFLEEPFHRFINEFREFSSHRLLGLPSIDLSTGKSIIGRMKKHLPVIDLNRTGLFVTTGDGRRNKDWTPLPDHTLWLLYNRILENENDEEEHEKSIPPSPSSPQQQEEDERSYQARKKRRREEESESEE